MVKIHLNEIHFIKITNYNYVSFLLKTSFENLMRITENFFITKQNTKKQTPTTTQTQKDTF